MKISCIIPAYNEEKTIRKVIKAVKKSKVFDEIIVVNDGSSDNTGNILSSEKDILFINLPHNLGKGGAVWHGIQNSDGEIIVMLDADLMGLTKLHFKKLIDPLLSDESLVCIGIIKHKDKQWQNLIQTVGSDLSGQQAFYKKMARDIDIKDSRFGIEIALKNHFKNKGLVTKKIALNGVAHIQKEEKMGTTLGLLARVKMYREVISAIFIAIISKLK